MITDPQVVAASFDFHHRLTVRPLRFDQTICLISLQTDRTGGPRKISSTILSLFSFHYRRLRLMKSNLNVTTETNHILSLVLIVLVHLFLSLFKKIFLRILEDTFFVSKATQSEINEGFFSLLALSILSVRGMEEVQPWGFLSFREIHEDIKQQIK